MGLLAPCKQRQSRDLQAERYVTGKAPPVRLVRNRLLSSQLDGRWTQDGVTNGVTPGSRVLGSQQDQADEELRRLLSDTQPSERWQEPLRYLLQSYYQPQEVRRALTFLLDNMKTAYRAVQNPEDSKGYPCLFIDTRNKPPVFDVDCWKRILIALHFELTEPEGFHDLDLIEVMVTNYIALEPLAGFMVVLHSLLNISWEMLRMVLALSTEEALRLLTVLHDVLSDGRTGDADIVMALHTRYPDELSALGLGIRRRKEVTWQRPTSDHAMQHVQVALAGLYHDGRGLETFI